MNVNYSTHIVRYFLTLFVGFIILFSASNTYTQLGMGLTPVTINLFLAIPFLIIFFFLTKLNIKLYTFDLYLLALILLVCASLIWTKDDEVWSNNIFWYFICILAFYLTRLSVNTLKDFKIINFFCFLSIFYSAASLNLGQDNYGNDLNRYSIEGININFTSYCLVAILYIVILFFNLKVFNSKTLFIIFNISTFLVLLLLETRGALISVFLMWYWVLIGKNLKIKINLIYFISLGIISFMVTCGLMNSFFLLLDTYFFGYRSTGDLSGRGEQWGLAYKIISENAFLGIGVGSFESINPNKIAVHNFYLNTLLELGLIGFLVISLLVWSTFFNGFKLKLNKKNLFIFGLFISFILPITLSGQWQLAPILWVVLALTFNFIRINENA